MFNLGDIVRVDFGNGEHDQVNGTFVHDRMRDLNGKCFRVVEAYAHAGVNRYKLADADNNMLHWTFVSEWLVAANGNEPTQDEVEMVECFDGVMRPIDHCVVLTYPSEHEGKYAWSIHTTKMQISGNANPTIILLDSEVHELTIEIDGDTHLLADVSEDDYVCCDGGSREGDYIWRDNAVYIEDDGYFFHEDDQGRYFWYHESDGEYHTYEPEDDTPTLSYHNQQSEGYISRTNAGTLYTIGFEVEKEDEDILDSYTTDDTAAIGWSREHDGSLNDETGYELVSPIYDLFDSELDDDIKKYPVLKDHINADSTTACGGHINFGKVGTRGSELLKECSAFLPLFIALYRKRAVSRWSKMRVDPRDYNGDERYVAFNVKRDYIEFRIVARVHDVDTMLWRRDLFRIMAKNPNVGAAKVQQMMLDRRSELHKHLRKMYTEDKLLRLACWYSQFADAMFDTLQFSKTGHGVMMDFFISSLRRNSKRVSVGIEAVEGWVQDVHEILSRADGGSRYIDNVKKVDKRTLRFLSVKG
jgi:hypothetical protein